MKKLTLFAIALLASIASFAALNPFAYGLSSKLSADETTLTVNYSLNAEATSVKVVILDGETVLKTVDCTTLGLTKGAYTTTIPTADLPKAKSLTWKVEVTGTEVTAPVESGSKKFYRPFSVAVDDNPESPYFGRILCGETYTSTNTKYVSYGVGSGIYEFNPALELIPNGEKPGYNGGKTFSNDDHSPYRIRISDEGRIFVTAHDHAGQFLWDVNPNNLNEWTSVFQGTHDTHQLLDAQGKFIAGTNAGFDVRGKGENLQLLMLSCKLLGTSVTTFQCHEYNLGTATKWTTVPTRAIGGCQLHSSMIARYSQVQYDKDGGFWCTYYVNSTTLGGIAHFTKEGVKDYEKHNIPLRAAGICFNQDFSKVIIAGNDIFGTLKETSKAVVYAVSKDADGKPVLTKETVINMASIAGNINDLAWDYGNNVYAVGNNGEWLCAYALPHAADAVVATPAASKYAFELQEEVGQIYTITANVNDPAMGKVTGAGEYEEGKNAILTANANDGYKFVNWTVGENTLTDNPLTLTVNANVTITANFVALTQYTITATVNDEAMGFVEGAGKYTEGKTVTLKATPKTHHEFVNWSNGATEATLTFVAEKDSTIVANFKKMSYTVTAIVNDELKGTISGTGTYEYGETATLEAVAAEGYELLYWSDRSTENPRTVTVDGNKVLNAYFVKEYDKEPTFKVEKLWENTNVPTSTNNGYQAAGWDQKIYMKDRVGQEILVFSDATTSATYATTDKADDQSIAADDAGNLILRSGTSAFYNTPKQVIIYKKGETNYNTIDFTLPAGGRCDFISASGDVFSAEGGYVYFYCQNKTTVNRVKIANGAYVSVDQIGSTLTAGQSQVQVIKNIFGNLITHARTAHPQEVDVTTGMVNNITLPNFKISTCGMATFELGGKEWIAYNVAGKDFNSEWNLYNMTDKKLLSETAFYAKNTTDINTAANWLNVQVVDEKTAYIYQFCPTVAVAVWKVTCDTGEEPENPTVLDNTVVAPQVEKIIRNGQVLIIRDGKTYNMMGQEVK